MRRNGGKALEIKEFGLFYFDEDGNLKFDPSRELSTEINFKYAGMEPVELKPPRGAAEMKEPEDEDGDAEESDIEEPVTKTRTAEEEEDLSAIFGFDEDDDKGKETDDDSDEIELPWGDLNRKKNPENRHIPKLNQNQNLRMTKSLMMKMLPNARRIRFAGLLGDASSKMSATDRGFSVMKRSPVIR